MHIDQPSRCRFRSVIPVALAGWLLALASCVSPVSRLGYGRDGFTAARLTSGHYRLTFVGKANVSLDEIKGELLRRSARVTLAAGYSHFVIYENSAEAEINNRSAAPLSNGDNGYLMELIRPAGPGDPSDARPYKGLGQADSNIRYTAMSEIMLLKGDAAAQNPDAVSAEEILDEQAP
jgi:hypothetical protein